MNCIAVHFSKTGIDIIASAMWSFDQTCIISEAMHCIIHICLCFPVRFSHIQTVQTCKLFAAFFQFVCDLKNDIASCLRVHISPFSCFIERFSGSCDGTSRILNGSFCDFCKYFTCSRVYRLKCFSFASCYPFAVNV